MGITRALAAALFLLASTAIAQTDQTVAEQTTEAPPSAVHVDCSAQQMPATITLDKKQMVVDLSKATAFVKSAIDAAQCQIGKSAPRFLLTNVDIDLQTVTDVDGNIEVLFIGGLAGEADKTTTADTDFTYSVPTLGNYPRTAHNAIINEIRVPLLWVPPRALRTGTI